jgi:hypothetical protein
MTCCGLEELRNYFWRLLDAIATLRLLDATAALLILATAISTEKQQVLK